VDPGDRPDAVFVANDHMAIPVIDTLRHEMGLRVARGCVGRRIRRRARRAWPAYSLTTVRQPADRMVAETVDLC
jgi:DNA-binding LacI/PurR family transcriptional regulator